MTLEIKNLPFCTPFIDIIGAAPCSTRCCAPNFVESYFYWGETCAKRLDDHTVELIQLPSYTSKAQEIFCKIILVLSYLTLIIPMIMLIAKSILRCGTQNLVIQAQQAQENPSRVVGPESHHWDSDFSFGNKSQSFSFTQNITNLIQY